MSTAKPGGEGQREHPLPEAVEAPPARRDARPVAASTPMTRISWVLGAALLVALAVLASSAFSEDELEQVASNRSIDDEVLAFLSRRRDWVSRYGVCRALVQNPRTPVGISVRLVTRLAVKDLKSLRRDRNIPEPVRSAAERLYRIKTA